MSKHKAIHIGIITALTFVIFAGGVYLLQSDRSAAGDQSIIASIVAQAEAQATDGPESGFRIIADEEITIDSRLWLLEQYPDIQIEGGVAPFILEPAGLPEGMRARINQENRIEFSGLPLPGTYDVSLALIDSENNTTHTNIQMDIEPLLLTTAQEVLNEWALWLSDDIEATYNMSEIETVTTLINLTFEQ